MLGHKWHKPQWHKLVVYVSEFFSMLLRGLKPIQYRLVENNLNKWIRQTAVRETNYRDSKLQSKSEMIQQNSVLVSNSCTNSYPSIYQTIFPPSFLSSTMEWNLPIYQTILPLFYIMYIGLKSSYLSDHFLTLLCHAYWLKSSYLSDNSLPLFCHV